MDGLEEELDGQLLVIRVDIHTRAGREIAEQYQFEYTPTFIFFDAQGTEQWREVGSLSEDRVRHFAGKD